MFLPHKESRRERPGKKHSGVQSRRVADQKGEVLKSRHSLNANLRLVPPRILADAHLDVLGEPAFQRMVSLERKRTERSGKPCLLMLLDAGDGLLMQRKRKLLEKIITALVSFTRETDVTGWYRQDRIAGAIFTEINPESLEFILKTMLARFKETLGAGLTSEELNQINISFRLFPESEEAAEENRPARRPYLSVPATPNRRQTPSVS